MVTGILRKEEVDWKKIRIRRDRNKENIGTKTEEKVANYLHERFPEYSVMNNLYFELDEYNSEIGMYRTMQIDHIVIGRKAVYVVETKHLPNNVTLTGSSQMKNWKYTECGAEGSAHRETNADSQNQKHKRHVENIINNKLEMQVPVISIVCIDGLEDKKILLNLTYKHEVVSMDELSDKIEYYEKILLSNYDELPRKKIFNLICEELIYDNIIPEIDDVMLKHLVYVKQIIKNRNAKSKTKKRRSVKK